MKYTQYLYEGSRAMAAEFTRRDGFRECNIMVEATDPTMSFDNQMSAVRQGLINACVDMNMPNRPMFVRYYLSDPVNQADRLNKTWQCSVSVIGQAPLNGTKIALWAVLAEDAEVAPVTTLLWQAASGGITHYWYTGIDAPDRDPHRATIMELDTYAALLKRENCSLAENCQRTWFFVRDVDANYHGVVSGRNDVFSRNGLSEETHFIASTGIGGVPPVGLQPLKFDAYAVKGLESGSVKYLNASDYLNSSIEYGVAFERATRIDYPTCSRVIVSGTASIDNHGKIIHERDVAAQTERMLLNIEMLLKEGGCGWDDVEYAVVYLRDISDYELVKNLLKDKPYPLIIVQGPVCRPGWLIEMECSAAKN